MFFISREKLQWYHEVCSLVFRKRLLYECIASTKLCIYFNNAKLFLGLIICIKFICRNLQIALRLCMSMEWRFVFQKSKSVNNKMFFYFNFFSHNFRMYMTWGIVALLFYYFFCFLSRKSRALKLWLNIQNLYNLKF